jgi:hypothetical protein
VAPALLPLSEPVALPPEVPPEVAPLLPVSELGGVAGAVLGAAPGAAVEPAVLELPLEDSGVAASFFPHAVSASAATMVASKTEYFMSIPLKKIYLLITTWPI